MGGGIAGEEWKNRRKMGRNSRVGILTSRRWKKKNWTNEGCEEK